MLLPATLIACDSDSATGPIEPLSLTRTSEHYLFHMAPGDNVDIAWQETYYQWIVAQLAVQPSERLEYHKYRNRAHLQGVTGRATNGFAEPGTARFHTIWARDDHEGVHTLVTLYIGHPPALFNEGLAVAHHVDPTSSDLTPRWSSQSVHTIARNVDQAGNLPPANTLVTSTGFFSFDTNITYPVAGSFVRFLIDRYGLARMKAFVSGSAFDDSALRTVTRFIGAYGKTVDEMWTEWRAWLRR